MLGLLINVLLFIIAFKIGEDFQVFKQQKNQQFNIKNIDMPNVTGKLKIHMDLNNHSMTIESDEEPKQVYKYNLHNVKYHN